MQVLGLLPTPPWVYLVTCRSSCVTALHLGLSPASVSTHLQRVSWTRLQPGNRLWRAGLVQQEEGQWTAEAMKAPSWLVQSLPPPSSALTASCID